MDWKVSLDRNQMFGIVFMDLSKAFDCLPHGLIIAKLHAYGLNLNACDLLSSYLCNRFQRVRVKIVGVNGLSSKSEFPWDLYSDPCCLTCL